MTNADSLPPLYVPVALFEWTPGSEIPVGKLLEAAVGLEQDEAGGSMDMAAESISNFPSQEGQWAIGAAFSEHRSGGEP